LKIIRIGGAFLYGFREITKGQIIRPLVGDALGKFLVMRSKMVDLACGADDFLNGPQEEIGKELL